MNRHVLLAAVATIMFIPTSASAKPLWVYIAGRDFDTAYDVNSRIFEMSGSGVPYDQCQYFMNSFKKYLTGIDGHHYEIASCVAYDDLAEAQNAWRGGGPRYVRTVDWSPL